MFAFWISLCSLFILENKAQCITKYVNYANGHIQGNLNHTSVIYLGNDHVSQKSNYNENNNKSLKTSIYTTETNVFQYNNNNIINITRTTYVVEGL